MIPSQSHEFSMSLRLIIKDHYGWVMVAVTSVFLAIGIGFFNAISVFLVPITTDLGWLRGDTSFAYLVGTIATGFGGIVMGYFADRYSALPVVLFGAICLTVGYFLLSRLETLFEFYLFYILLGGLGMGALYAPLMANVGNWFTTNKGLAIGITSSGQALGNGVFPYFASYLIVNSGWRTAYTACGLISLVLLVPLALLVRTPPLSKTSNTLTKEPSAPEEEIDPMIARISVPWLSFAVVFCCICMATPIIHVVALAQDKGFDGTRAAGVLSLLMISGFFGRIAFGKVADYIGGLRAYILTSAGQTVLVFWFTQLDSLIGFYILAVLFGFWYAGVMTCLTVCIREMTPIHKRSLSLAIVTLFGWLGMGLGGYQGGFFFDLSGDYILSYFNATLAGLINLAILGALYFYIHKRPQLRQVVVQ